MLKNLSKYAILSVRNKSILYGNYARGIIMAENNIIEGKAIIHSLAEISIAPNYTTAFMSLSAPENGGSDMTFERAMAAIKDKNIYYGIMEDAVRDAVDNKRYGENICIAKWTPTEDGVDGKVTYLFSTDSKIAPVENEHGVVDYKDLGIVRNITKGTTIATITLPTEGSAGTDITGKPVAQKKGVPANVRTGKGTSLINNGTELIAAVDGNLRYINGEFVVEEELFINGDVDVSSGNIDFIGNVNIRGSVFEGFKVTSKKNITVNGSVTGAELTADGDITVRIGANGSTINCKGNVKLGFCENSKITCDNNVESVSFVGGEVFAGKCIIATGKGVMMGGKYTALENIEASVIGSQSYAKTELTLGNNAVLSKEKETLLRGIAEFEDKSEQLNLIIKTLEEQAKKAKLTPEREQLRLTSVRNKLKLQSEIAKSKRRISEIEVALELCQNLSVSVKSIIYPGVTLRINAFTLKVNTANSHCRATIVDGDIAFMPL